MTDAADLARRFLTLWEDYLAALLADPAAVAVLKADGDPTGKLPIPVVSIHSINDPQVPVEQQAAYRATVAAGNPRGICADEMRA